MNLEKLIELARMKLTPEQREAAHKAMQERLDQMDRDNIARNRCRLCGADTINYSHTFDCPRRGSGF